MLVNVITSDWLTGVYHLTMSEHSVLTYFVGVRGHGKNEG